MDLQEFVSETLAQIVNGVDGARKRVDSKDIKICPQLDGTAAHKGNMQIVAARGDAPATMVEFDVALSTTEDTGTKGGIGVVAGFVTLGSTGESSRENRSVSHVRFSIPVILQRKGE